MCGVLLQRIPRRAFRALMHLSNIFIEDTVLCACAFEGDAISISMSSRVCVPFMVSIISWRRQESNFFRCIFKHRSNTCWSTTKPALCTSCRIKLINGSKFGERECNYEVMGA